MYFAEFWLPIIGCGIFVALAFGAWYGGNKIPAIWASFAGAVCLLLLAALQIQENIKEEPVPESPEAVAQRVYAAAQATSQRAWLTVLPKLNTEVKKGKPIDIELVLENVGKEPAIGVHHYGMAMMFDMPDDTSYAPEIWTPQFAEVISMGCELAPPTKGLATIFPGQKPSTPFQWDNVEDVQSLINKKKILVMYGCVGYFTMEGKHHTTYCLFLMRDKKTGKWQIGSAPIGNDAT